MSMIKIWVKQILGKLFPCNVENLRSKTNLGEIFGRTLEFSIAPEKWTTKKERFVYFNYHFLGTSCWKKGVSYWKPMPFVRVPSRFFNIGSVPT